MKINMGDLNSLVEDKYLYLHPVGKMKSLTTASVRFDNPPPKPVCCSGVNEGRRMDAPRGACENILLSPWWCFGSSTTFEHNGPPVD